MALTPTKTGLGYQYREQDGTIRQVGRREMTEELKPTAITFTKALPLRALKVKDLIWFTWSAVSGSNALLLKVCALVVVLLGMFPPMVTRPEYAVEDVADQCGISRTHFHSVFKQYNGLTPAHYLKRLRRTG